MPKMRTSIVQIRKKLQKNPAICVFNETLN